jgi:hypothetical protein
MKRNKAADVFKKIDMCGGDTSKCWLWTGKLARDGRPYFDLNGRKVLAYRLTYELVHGGIPEGKMLCHQCDTPACCNPYHTIPGTHDENMDEMKQRERHGLPHHTIRRIRARLERGDKHADIADDFGISVQVIGHINTGRLYSHVTKEVDNDETAQ